MRNFRSYTGEEAVFDFRGRRLLGIVGPIGSGKSTVLDGIAFALYGRTPIVAQAVKSLINQRSDSSAVLLRFEVEGEVWEVVRSLRRQGQSQVGLYHLQSDEDDADTIERLVGKADVDSRVQQLLGLDFDAFGRSVLLAQGRFAQLLQAPPAERDKVLKGVFGHDRIGTMRAIAKARADESRSVAEPIQARADQLAAVAARVETANGELIAVEERLQLLTKSEPRMADLTTSQVEAADALKRQQELLAGVERAAAGLPSESDAGELIALAHKAARQRSSQGTAVGSARSALQDAEAIQQRVHSEESVAEAAEVFAGAEQLGAALTRGRERLSGADEKRTRAAAALEDAKAGLIRAEKEAEEAEAGMEAARDRLREAEQEVHLAHRADMARTLQGALEVGHECPVCRQEVSHVPDLEDANLSAVTKALEDARAGREAADERRLETANARSGAAEVLAAAGDGLRSALQGLEEAQVETASVEADLEEVLARLSELLGPGEPAELIALRRQRIAEVDEAVGEARRRLDLAQEALDEAVESDHRAGREIATLRIGLFDLAAVLGADAPDDDALEVLERFSADVYARRSSAFTEGTAKVQELERVRDLARAEQETLLLELGVEDLARAIGAAEQEAKMMGDSIAADHQELEAGAELLEESTRLQERIAVYDQLAADLRDARFVRYLLDEERSRLAHLGSDHLQRLTSGRYRFTDIFEIEDLTSAEAVRRADSLSGGESFLASLALALALAEMVSRTGGRLDAFFLDEGFGALDPEHLDLAMEGLESLVSGESERLVVVVSHVPELRSRVEDLIELDRQAHTGDTIIVSGAAR